MTLIKSEFNRLFGGYASVSWTSKEQSLVDNNAFLYSLTYRTKHKLVKNKHQALKSGGKGYLMVFGGGDLQIYDKCDS